MGTLLHITMNYQRLVNNNVSLSGRPVFLKALRLIRNGGVYDISETSTNEAEREFYSEWLKCSHKNSIIVINPPNLCHIFIMFDAIDGTQIASVCPNCTKCMLNAVNCYNPLTKLKHSNYEYVVTDLTKVPKDLPVFEENNKYYVKSNIVATLSDELKQYFQVRLYEPDSIVIRAGPIAKARKRITVAEALEKQRRPCEEVQYAVIVDGENVGSTTSTE